MPRRDSTGSFLTRSFNDRKQYSITVVVNQKPDDTYEGEIHIKHDADESSKQVGAHVEASTFPEVLKKAASNLKLFFVSTRNAAVSRLSVTLPTGSEYKVGQLTVLAAKRLIQLRFNEALSRCQEEPIFDEGLNERQKFRCAVM